MRSALFILFFAALSWPALARQDQSQTPATQNPPESQVPATAPPPSSQAPAPSSTPAGTQQAPATQAPASSEQAAKKKTRKKTSPKKSPKKHKKKAPEKAPDPAADAGPRRVVVRRGGTSDTGGQLEPGVPQSEADHQRQSTDQLLENTGANLKKISQRKLTPDQQDMVRQITFYMEQSRSANQEGDLGRARNLALKAHQLCDALARQ